MNLAPDAVLSFCADVLERIAKLPNVERGRAAKHEHDEQSDAEVNRAFLHDPPIKHETTRFGGHELLTEMTEGQLGCE